MSTTVPTNTQTSLQKCNFGWIRYSVCCEDYPSPSTRNDNEALTQLVLVICNSASLKL